MPGLAAARARSVPSEPERNVNSDQPSPTPDTFDEKRWIELVSRIQANEPAALEELYQVFNRGVRFMLCRKLGPDQLEDRVHDSYLTVVGAIQRGDVREPSRILGFMRTVVQRQVAGIIESAARSRRHRVDLDADVLPIRDPSRDPEQELVADSRVALMHQVLAGICVKDREILTRFYLEGQTQEQICAEMRLSPTQFRLLKSRAKSRFGELGRRKLSRRPLTDWMTNRFGSKLE